MADVSAFITDDEGNQVELIYSQSNGDRLLQELIDSEPYGQLEFDLQEEDPNA